MKRWLVEGEKLVLGPLVEELVSTYFQWEIDPELRALSGQDPGQVPAVASEWFASLRSTANQVHFTVHETLFQLQDTGPRPVGRACIHRIDHRHRTAELFVVLGDRALWGQGIGSETVQLLLDWAFRSMDLHCVHARIPSFNVGGLRVAMRAGMREAGRFRQAFRVNREVHDVCLFECLATEFQAPTPGVSVLR